MLIAQLRLKHVFLIKFKSSFLILLSIWHKYMKIVFEKYHGAGNDFIIIDNRNNVVELSSEHIALMCHRRFGIGADGLMLLQKSDSLDFKMTYYNADGYEGSLCGNGGRCIVYFARQKGVINAETKFEAIDGEHQAVILSGKNDAGIVSLKMADVKTIEKFDNDYFLNTGSPHYVKMVEELETINSFELGKSIRWDKRFQPGGTNVNFVSVENNNLFVRTFERGVENLTLACGTGVVASAIVAAEKSDNQFDNYFIKTDGGDLKVKFIKNNNIYSDIWLEGPVKKVFDGIVER